NHPVLNVSPQRHQQLARQRHDPDPPLPRTTLGKTPPEPPAQLALPLVAQPQPRQLHHQRADPPVARLADALLARALSAGMRRRRQPRARRHLLAAGKRPPPEQLRRQHPARLLTHSLELLQPPRLVRQLTLPQHHPLLLLTLELANLPIHQLVARHLTLDLRHQLRRQRTARAPLATPLEHPGNLAHALHHNALQDEQRLDPRPVRTPLLHQPLALARQPPGPLLLNRRHPYHPQRLALAPVPAHQQRQQRLHVHSVRLHLPAPPAHLDTRRVHHHVDNPQPLQRTMNPEPVTTRLVTAHHRTTPGYTQLLARHPNLLAQRHQIPGLYRLHPPPRSVAKSQLPALLAQLQCHVQNLHP